MAVYPYFVLSPKTVVSLIGWLKGPDRTIPTFTREAADITVDVVIPCLNEERNIVLCLESVTRQTMRPRRIVLVDDGSTDRTVEFAEAFCRQNDLDLLPIRRKAPIGKTPTLKRQARELDSDVEFILDADTVLESNEYIERTVEELYKGAGVWSACGVIMPLRARDRQRLTSDNGAFGRFYAEHPAARLNGDTPGQRISRGITNTYRETLYSVLQRFIYRGEMILFGTIVSPVGCAVAYRREYLRNVFDLYEPYLGDDLTTSEDVFLGFAALSHGYRNVQLQDVVARTVEPEATGLLKQVRLWSSAFLQSCFYFDDLVKSPFKWLRRYRKRKRSEQMTGMQDDRRENVEPYRQPFGRENTMLYGRPMGWTILMAAVEKLFFPAALLVMVLLGLWEALLVTLVAEVVLMCLFLVLSARRGERIEFLLKGILTTPIRYVVLLADILIVGRFAYDLWIRGKRDWRK